MSFYLPYHLKCLSKLLILTLLLWCTSTVVLAQSTSNKGTSFWTAYMGHIDGTSSNMSLYITSDLNTTGTVSIPGKSWSTSYSVTANTVTVVSIPQSLAYMNCSDCILKQGIYITSVEPVVVYAHIYANARSDATLVLPTETAGRDYYAMSFTQKVTGNNRQNEFLVIGIEDSTFVDITPTAGTLSGSHTKGITYTKMLMQGEVYQVQSDSDLTATHIVSYGSSTSGCKRAAVFSGSSFTPLGCSGASSGDNLFQQMYPASAWGKVYITAPMKTRTGGDYFRVLSSKSGTKVTINNWNTQTLNAGQYYEWLTDSAQYITATEGICLAQYQRTQNCDNVTGDPSMIILNSTEQQLNDITLYSSSYQSITGSYINVYMQSDDTSIFYIDNVKPTWKTIPSKTNFAYAQQTVNSGNHHLYADSGFNAVAYGFGNVESYGYSAGANIQNQSQSITLKYGPSSASCVNQPIYFKGICVYTPIRWQWYFGDGGTDTLQNPSHAYADTGTYTVSLVTTKSNGNDCDSKDSTVYKIKVYMLPTPKIAYSNNCSNDYVKFFDSSFVPAYYITGRVWDFGDGSQASSKNPSHQYASPGTYTVKLTITSTGNCYATDSAVVVVNSSPVVNFYLTERCIKDSIELFDSSTLDGVYKTNYNCYKSAISWGDGKSDTIYNTIGNKKIKHQYSSGANYTVKILGLDCYTGCKDSSTQQISIESATQPKFVMSNGCQKDSILIIDSSSISYGSIVSWSWNFGDASTKSYSSAIGSFKKLYTNAGSYSAILITQNTDGCSDTFSQTITISPKPKPGFSNTTVCYPDTTFFTDTSSISSGSIVSSRWFFGDGKDTTVYGVSSLRKVYASAGTYTVKLVVTSNTGCVDSISRAIVVNTKPNASFSMSNTCENDSVAVTDNSSGSGIIQRWWSWGNGDTTTKTSTSFKYRYANEGTYTVNLIISSGKGCSDTFSKNVVIYEQPLARFGYGNFCYGDSAKVFDSSSVSSSTINKFRWHWDDGDSTVYAASKYSTSHLYQSADTFNIRLIVQTAQGCRDTAIHQVYIYRKPVAAFSVSNTCLNDSTSFIDSSVLGAFNAARWYWKFGDGSIDSSLASASIKHFYGQKTTFNPTLVVIDSFGCADTAVLSIQIDTVPYVDFSYISACASDSISFTNHSSISSSSIISIDMQWGDSSSSNYMNNPTGIKHQYRTGGYKQVMLTATSNKSCKDSVVKNIYVKPLPVSAFTLPNICYKDSVTFQDLSTVDSGAIVLWKFNFGDGDTVSYQSKNNFKHKYDTVGTYNISLKTTSDMGCTDSIVIAYTVNSNPIAGIGWLKPCINDSVMLLDSTFIAFGSVYKWRWEYSDGGTDTLQNPKHLFSDTGIFQLKLFVQSGNLCKDSISRSIHIRPAPKAGFQFNNACFGDSVQFLPSSSSTQGFIDSSRWNFGDGNMATSTGNNPIRKLYLSSGQYLVTLTAVSSFLCTDTLSKALTIYEKPTAFFTALNVCEYDSVKALDFSSFSTDTLKQWKYYWGDGDSNIYNSATSAVKHRYANDGNYTLSQVVKTIFGCSDTFAQIVKIHERPQAVFGGGNFNQCFNDNQVVFKDSSAAMSGSVQRLFDFGDNQFDTSVSVTHHYNVFGDYLAKLFLITDSGCVDTALQSIHIYASPNPLFSLNKNMSCLSGNQFYGFDSTTIGNGTYTRKLNWGDGSYDTSMTQGHQYTNPGKYIIWLLATSDNNCMDSISDSVIVHPMPTVDFSFSDQCNGDSVSITDNSAISADSLVQWNWSFGDGQQLSYTKRVDSLTHLYTGANTYSLKLKLSSNRGCQDSLTKSLNINALPVPYFKVTNKCIYDSLLFEDSSTLKTGSIFSWEWDWGDSSKTVYSGYKKVNRHLYQYEGFHRVQLKLYSSKGCSDSFVSVAFVNSVPIAKLTFNDVCVGEKLIVYDSSTINNGKVFLRHWNWGDFSADQSVGLDTSHLYSGSGNYTIQLIAESDSGCLDTNTAITVVHPKPAMNFTLNGSCSDDSARMRDFSFLSFDTIVTQKWQYGDGKSSSYIRPFKGITHHYDRWGTYQVQLTNISNFGCRDSLSKTVYIKPSPKPLFTSKDVCKDDTSTFKNLSAIDTGSIIKYHWNYMDGDSLNEYSFVSENKHLYKTAADYIPQLTCISDQGCISTFKGSAIIHPLPVAAFKPQNHVGCEIFKAVFTDLSTVKRDSLVEWYWQFGDNTTDTTASPVHYYMQRGLYQPKLTVKSSAGCVDTWEDTIPIIANEQPVADFIPTADTISSLNPSCHFVNTSQSSTRWFWKFDDIYTSKEKNPTHRYSDTGFYQVMLIAYNPYNCSDTAYHRIYIIPDYTFFLSNAFTPNTDDLNESWGPDGIFDGIRKYELSIYNRWGERVFTTTNIYDRWNGLLENTGKECQQDLYIYRIDYTDFLYKKYNKQGHLLLLR